MMVRNLQVGEQSRNQVAAVRTLSPQSGRPSERRMPHRVRLHCSIYGQFGEILPERRVRPAPTLRASGGHWRSGKDGKTPQDACLPIGDNHAAATSHRDRFWLLVCT